MPRKRSRGRGDAYRAVLQAPLATMFVVGFMGTQFTVFNDAKLWSPYFVIGNDLRYNNPIYITRRSSTLPTL
jgi:hypothetical protein